MVLVPVVNTTEQIRNPRYMAFVSILASFVAFFGTALSGLLAILGFVAGIIGIVFSIKNKKWGALTANIIGFLLAAVALISMISGDLPTT